MIQPFRLMTFRLMAHSLIAAHAPMCLYPLSLALLCLYPLSLSLCSGSTEGERGDAGILSVPHVVVSSLSPLSLRLPKAQAHDLPRPSPPLPFSLLPGAPPAAPPAGKRRGGRGWGRGGGAPGAAGGQAARLPRPQPRPQCPARVASTGIWGRVPLSGAAAPPSTPPAAVPSPATGHLSEGRAGYSPPSVRLRHRVLATPAGTRDTRYSRHQCREYPVTGGYHVQREGSTRYLGGIIDRGRGVPGNWGVSCAEARGGRSTSSVRDCGPPAPGPGGRCLHP